MIKRISNGILLGLCALIITAAGLQADEVIEKKNVIAGERAASVKERTASRKARAVAVNKAEKEQGTAPAEAKSVARSLRPSAKSLARGVYLTTHPGAYQHPVSISVYGDSVELMDGSIWTIAARDAYKTLNWYPADLIVITPNHNWFTSYDFKLTNQTTGVSVAADMYLGPIDPAYNSPYTHWIVGIDYYYNEVYLEDGTIWNMSAFDRSTIDQWIIGDIIMIGVNDGWLSSSNPNILINVNLLNWAAGSTAF